MKIDKFEFFLILLNYNICVFILLFHSFQNHHEILISNARRRHRNDIIFKTNQNKRLTYSSRRGSTKYKTKINGKQTMKQNDRVDVNGLHSVSSRNPLITHSPLHPPGPPSRLGDVNINIKIILT